MKGARIGVERSGRKRAKWTLIRRRGSVVHHAPLPLGVGLERQRPLVGQARDLYLPRGGVRRIIKTRKGTLGDRRGIRMWWRALHLQRTMEQSVVVLVLEEILVLVAASSTPGPLQGRTHRRRRPAMRRHTGGQYLRHHQDPTIATAAASIIEGFFHLLLAKRGGLVFSQGLPGVQWVGRGHRQPPPVPEGPKIHPQVCLPLLERMTGEVLLQLLLLEEEGGMSEGNQLMVWGGRLLHPQGGIRGRRYSRPHLRVSTTATATATVVLTGL